MAGIEVVQLHPVEQVFTASGDVTHIMLAVIELSRGNSESKMKSERVGAAWAKKQKDAGARVVTRSIPG